MKRQLVLKRNCEPKYQIEFRAPLMSVMEGDEGYNGLFIDKQFGDGGIIET